MSAASALARLEEMATHVAGVRAGSSGPGGALSGTAGAILPFLGEAIDANARSGAASDVARALEGYAVVVDWQHKEDVSTPDAPRHKGTVEGAWDGRGCDRSRHGESHGRSPRKACAMTALAHSLDFGGETVSFSIERTSRRKTVAISVGYDASVFLPLPIWTIARHQHRAQEGPWVLQKQAGYGS